MSVHQSYVRRTLGILAISMVTLATAGAYAQQPVRDKWITMKVHSYYVDEDVLSGSNIDVDTSNGVVTLSGTVVSEAGRARAIAIAKTTNGAKSVVDKLRIGPHERELDEIAREAAKDTKAATKEAVKDTKAAAKEATKDTKAGAKEVSQDTKAAARSTGRKITDGWVKSKIYAQYLVASTLDDSDIDIDVANGIVTLNGTVKTAEGKARAVTIAKTTDRVKGVKDNLKIG